MDADLEDPRDDIDTSLTCVARLTPPGAGAIATLRIEGPGAARVVKAHVRTRSGKPADDWPNHRPILGFLGEPPGEPVVVHRRDDRTIELHCHGGIAAVERIERGLTGSGARAIGWQDWIRRRHADPITAEARIAIAHARTERTAAILLDQFGGALRRATDEVERLMLAGNYIAAREQLDLLLARAELGTHLTRPWRVVLTGRPNVGKSSLMNAMLGFERAIVHSSAGTTRDVLTATTAIDGWPVELTDTAGLSSTTTQHGGDTLVGRGSELAREQVATADLVLLVFDGSVSISDEEKQWLDDWPDALLVDNKDDLPRAPGARPPTLKTNALQGDGVPHLLAAIARRLVPSPPGPGAAVPFTEEQCRCLRDLAARMPTDGSTPKTPASGLPKSTDSTSRFS